MQNTPKHVQKHAFNPVLTRLCEILCQPEPLFAKFSIHTHCSSAKFSLICLEKSRSPKRTQARQRVASKRTFGGLRQPEVEHAIGLNLYRQFILDLGSRGFKTRDNAMIVLSRKTWSVQMLNRILSTCRMGFLDH